MKKIFLPILFVVFSSQFANAQVRHLKGQKGMEVMVGITEHSQVFGGGFSQYLSSNLYLKGALGYENGTISNVDFTAYLIDITANYMVFSVNSQVFFNAVLGASGIYEETEFLESTFDQDGFSPGMIGGLEIEIFLNDKIILLTNGSQRHYFQSELGESRWLVTAGLKYIF